MCSLVVNYELDLLRVLARDPVVAESSTLMKPRSTEQPKAHRLRLFHSNMKTLNVDMLQLLHVFILIFSCRHIKTHLVQQWRI